MGGSKPKADPDLKRRQQEEQDRAERERDRLRRERISQSAARRRGSRGRRSLLGTEGGELGSKSLLGSSDR